MTSRNTKKLIFIGSVIFLIMVILVVRSCIDGSKRTEAIEKCKEKVQNICTQQGIADANVNIAYAHRGKGYLKGYDIYTLKVESASANVPLPKIYQVVSAVDSIHILFDIWLEKEIKFNNKIYKLDVINENELTCDGEVVYTYVSEEEKALLAKLKNELPYKGLEEKYINCTKLGEAEKEYCTDYFKLQYDRRYITYIWRDTEGKSIAEATVGYKKSKAGGYVYHVWFSNSLKNK